MDWNGILTSKTIITAEVGVVLAFAKLFHKDLGIDSDSLADLLLQLSTLAAFVLAGVFRTVATNKLHGPGDLAEKVQG